MTKITERSVAADIAGEVNKILQSGGLPFDKATVEDRAGVGYPDFILWENYTAKKAFAFLELKAPDGQKEDLTRLPAKAQDLDVSYAVVWNFLNGTLYEFSPTGTMVPRKAYPIPLLTTLDQWRNAAKRIQVIQQAERILNDLASLQRDGAIHPFVPDKVYFIHILRDAVTKLQPLLEQHLISEKAKRTVRERVNKWAVNQGIPTSTPELDSIIARQWSYSIALRILFYLTVRRHFEHLPDLKPSAPHQSTISLLSQAFSQAQGVDWQAVFEQDILDQLGLPSAAEPILHDLLNSFHRYDFGLLKEDVIGEIFEGLIPAEERHALGQYFTREDLVDFIIGFVADRADASFLDPTCGTGTFLIRLYSRLRWLSQYHHSHAQLLGQIWGVDVAKFPAELATINLFRQNARDITSFPRVIPEDFFRVNVGATFRFPPPQATTIDYQKINVPVPTFHGIVGNLPYIRQELIEKEVEGYKRSITQSVARRWFWQDRALFDLDDISEKELEAVQSKDDAARQKWLER